MLNKKHSKRLWKAVVGATGLVVVILAIMITTLLFKNISLQSENNEVLAKISNAMALILENPDSPTMPTTSSSTSFSSPTQTLPEEPIPTTLISTNSISTKPSTEPATEKETNSTVPEFPTNSTHEITHTFRTTEEASIVTTDQITTSSENSGNSTVISTSEVTLAETDFEIVTTNSTTNAPGPEYTSTSDSNTSSDTSEWNESTTTTEYSTAIYTSSAAPSTTNFDISTTYYSTDVTTYNYDTDRTAHVTETGTAAFTEGTTFTTAPTIAPTSSTTTGPPVARKHAFQVLQEAHKLPITVSEKTTLCNRQQVYRALLSLRLSILDPEVRNFTAYNVLQQPDKQGKAGAKNAAAYLALSEMYNDYIYFAHSPANTTTTEAPCNSTMMFVSPSSKNARRKNLQHKKFVSGKMEISNFVTLFRDIL